MFFCDAKFVVCYISFFVPLFLLFLVQNWIKTTAEEFVTQCQELSLPGINEYLRSEKGQQFLQLASKSNVCFIKLDSADNPEWQEARKVN